MSPDRYAVIGHPIAHSRSPRIHSLFAGQTGQSITYERVLAPLDGFAGCVADFAAAGHDAYLETAIIPAPHGGQHAMPHDLAGQRGGEPAHDLVVAAGHVVHLVGLAEERGIRRRGVSE